MPRSKRRKGARKNDVRAGGEPRQSGGRKYYDPGAKPRPADPSKKLGAKMTGAAKTHFQRPHGS